MGLHLTTNEMVANNLLDLFKNQSTKFSFFLTQFDISIVPYNSRGLGKFSTLSTEKQQQVINNLNSYMALCERAIKDGINIHNDSDKFLWWTLKEFRLIPSSRLMNFIKPNMTIEIYNLDCIQIFRTLNLFKFISYSLSELLTFEWWELFSRNPEIETLVSQGGLAAVTGKIDIEFANIAAHEVYEVLDGEKKFSGIMKPYLYASVKNREGKQAAGIAAYNAYPSWASIS